jgi:hypothetical protein
MKSLIAVIVALRQTTERITVEITHIGVTDHKLGFEVSQRIVFYPAPKRIRGQLPS